MVISLGIFFISMSWNVRFEHKKTFDVKLLSLFNIHEIWQDFRMMGYWKTSRTMGFNMHKTLLCIVTALTFAWIVNWWEESEARVYKLSKKDCEDSGYDCIGVLQGLDENDMCTCVQTRSIVILVTVVLVGILGLYITYGQMLKIIFRNWLRFNVVSTVWEVTNYRLKCSVESKGSVSGRQRIIGEKRNVYQHPSTPSVGNNEPDSESASESLSVKIIDHGSKLNNTCQCVSRHTRGFAMDRKAMIDDVFLLVGEEGDEDFIKLVKFVKKEIEEVRNKKKYYNKLKTKITQPNGKRYSMKEKAEISIYQVNLTRRIRNIIMQGTTIFTLAPSKNSKILMQLVAKGRWSGGAFLPEEDNHRAISHTATQHYEISFSMETKKIAIERSHMIDDEEFKIHGTMNRKLGFVSNRRLTIKSY